MPPSRTATPRPKELARSSCIDDFQDAAGVILARSWRARLTASHIVTLLYMTVDASRRRATSQQTRARLLDAAKTLFLAEGYEGTSVRAVADAAEVTVGAFYGHFSSAGSTLGDPHRRH